MENIKVNDTQSLPKCPYCESEIKEMEKAVAGRFVQLSHVYICPHCKKILGITTSLNSA
jgi:DNA-directed RNA polymerase subunit RPC12/RpoP